MHLAIIGAGNVGGALGRGWARSGHAIRYGVSDPGDPRHAETAKSAGGAMVMNVRDAVAEADVIILAVPWDAAPAAISSCGDLQGRVLVDVTNPLKVDAQGLELALGFDRSGGEIVASLAKGASVFKTLNQVGYQVMDDTAGYASAPAMFVAGDDEEAKPVVMRLVEELGFEALDVGPLKIARLLEPYAMLWIHQAVVRKAPLDNAFAFLRRNS